MTKQESRRGEVLHSLYTSDLPELENSTVKTVLSTY